MRYFEINEGKLDSIIPSFNDLVKKYPSIIKFNAIDAGEAQEMGYDVYHPNTFKPSPKRYYNSFVKSIKKRFDKDGYIFLYRTLNLRKTDRVDTKDIGIHWSTNIINEKSCTHLLSGKIHYSDIDWFSTLLARFEYPYESEITLKPMRKIKDLKIEERHPVKSVSPSRGHSWPTPLKKNL